MTILIVDDNKQNIYLLQVILQSSGYQVVSAANGAEALEKARKDLPNLVVSDILMPVMDGFTLCVEWKKDERLRLIPFIFFTATYTDERDKEFALSLGAERFIVKPEEPASFMQTVKEVLEQARSSPAAPAREAIEMPQGNEDGQLQQYNAALIRKLEDKMQQLEKTNRELERSILERKRAEEEVKKLNQELDERVKQRTTELVAANKYLDAFNHSIAHDLKAPLRAISGFAHMLEEDYRDKIDDKGRRLVNVIGENVTRMGQLIDDLLALARVNKLEMQIIDINMMELAQSVCNELKALPPNDNRSIEVSVKPLPPARADLTLVKQILTNVVSNAMKFTARKEKALIEIGGYGKGPENVYYVKDNGAGFDMKLADKLFDIFQRLHSPDEFGGTGIGLAIVESAVQRHGGIVWAEAEIDKGAIFHFTLPKG